MKKTIFTFLAIISCSASYSQENAVAKILYQFKHVNDTTQRDKYIKDEVITYLGQHSSYYTSNSANRISEQMNEQMSNPAFDGNIKLRGSGTAIRDSYLTDVSNSSLRKVRKIGSGEFLVNEDFPSMDWIILEETKDIGGYSCQKATTSFKGRNYEAWFCADIPLAYGPWKLQGLPGLILAAKDDKDEVVFEYAGFDKIGLDDKQVAIAISSRAVESTEEDVVSLDKAFRDNPAAFMKTQSSNKNVAIVSVNNSVSAPPSGGGSTFMVQGVPAGDANIAKIKSVNVVKDDTHKSSPITNNPIELKK